jgi:GT2 family glycosyltransferase
MHPRLEYIPCGGNIGFGRANNIGIEHALKEGADNIGIINPDVWFEPAWLKPILSAFVSHNEYGVLAPLQLEYTGDALSEWARKIVGPERVRAWRQGDKPIDVPWIEGSAMVIRREVIETIGVFDEIFDMYFEDNDLCRRARLAGYEIGVVPGSRYHHYGSGSFGGNHSSERNIRCDLSQLIYTMTDPERSIAANLCNLTYASGQLGWGWLTGRRTTFPHVMARFITEVSRKRKAIWKKWNRERAFFTRSRIVDRSWKAAKIKENRS